MTDTQRHADQEILTRRYQYADGELLAFDLGPGTAGSVDVVDGTVLVVTEDGQREFDLPEGFGPVESTMTNGVVTVETGARTTTVDPESTGDDSDGDDAEDADTSTDAGAEAEDNTEDNE